MADVVPPGWMATGKSLGTVDLMGARRRRQIVVRGDGHEGVLDLITADSEYLKALCANAEKLKERTSSRYIGNILDAGFADEQQFYQVSDLCVKPFERTPESPLSEKRLGAIFADLFFALNDMHEQGLMHCAFWPLAIWWNKSLQIGELWWVHAIEGGAPNKALAEFFPAEIPDLILDYCAPELLLEGNVSPAADVFALGATLYYLATGEPPRGRGLSADRRQFVGMSKVKPVTELRPDLTKVMRTLIAAMLLVKPEKRATMTALKPVAEYLARPS